MSGVRQRGHRAETVKAKVSMWIVQRASRDTGIVDNVCRRLLSRALRIDPERDFMRDDWVDSDVGFDPEELARYERGESQEG